MIAIGFFGLGLYHSPELFKGIVSQALKLSAMKHDRIHNPQKFDQEILNFYRTLKLHEFQRYVRLFNLTELEQVRLFNGMSADLNSGADAAGFDKLLKLRCALSPALLPPQFTNTPTRQRERRSVLGRRSKIRTSHQLRDLPALPQRFAIPEHNGLETSPRRTYLVDTTAKQISEFRPSASVEARLQSVMNEWRSEIPIPIRSEVHRRLKPHLNSFPRRRNISKRRRTQIREFDQAVIERISFAIQAVRERRSGVKSEPGRIKDDVRIDTATWKREVRKEIPDATDEIMKKLRREVYKFNDRKRNQNNAG